MNTMYDDAFTKAEAPVEIDGYPFYAEEITSNEPYNRRETNRQSILGGTEFVTRGKYIVRDFSFSTHIHIPEGRPDRFDDVFREMVRKPCEVISPYMGGKFNAEVIIEVNAEESSPEDLKLDIQVIEIPDVISNIPGEEQFIPADELQEDSK